MSLSFSKGNHVKKQWLLRKMEIAGLNDGLRKRFPHQLLGCQLRVEIIPALAASPDILLMDEPFSTVDKITRSSLQEEIKKSTKLLGLPSCSLRMMLEKHSNLAVKYLYG